jgi:hypothetical protein
MQAALLIEGAPTCMVRANKKAPPTEGAFLIQARGPYQNCRRLEGRIARNGDSTAPFTYECQSFLDNVIAGSR